MTSACLLDLEGHIQCVMMRNLNTFFSSENSAGHLFNFSNFQHHTASPVVKAAVGINRE